MPLAGEVVPVGLFPAPGQVGYQVCGTCHAIVAMVFPDGSSIGSLDKHMQWHREQQGKG